MRLSPAAGRTGAGFSGVLWQLGQVLNEVMLAKQPTRKFVQPEEVAAAVKRALDQPPEVMATLITLLSVAE